MRETGEMHEHKDQKRPSRACLHTQINRKVAQSNAKTNQIKSNQIQGPGLTVVNAFLFTYNVGFGKAFQDHTHTS